MLLNVNDDSSDTQEDEPVNYDPKKGKKWVDGGKLPPKTQKEI